MERDQSVGDQIWFAKERMPYVVKACNERFLICTKPFNLRNTVLYTIIDLDNNIRSTNDLTFNMYDYKDQSDIDTCLLDLISGKIELSKRNQVDLYITRIVKKPSNLVL